MSILNNKRGIYNETMIIIVIFIGLMTIMGLFWIVGSIGPLIVGEGKVLTTQLSNSINANSPNSELANASQAPIQLSNNLLGIVEAIVYLCFVGSFLGFIAVCYYVRTYRWLSMAWIGLVIGAVVIAMIMSNSYQMMYDSSTDLASLYSEWGTNDFVLRYLPFIIGIFGVIGGIILFAIQSTGGDEETSTVN